MSHTTTSKTMSALPLRLCRHMHASTTSGAAVQVLPMASAMGSEAELAALREQLTAAVASQDFAQAALLKPQVEALQVKLDEQAAGASMPTATASAFAPGAGAPGSMPSATVASAGTGRYDGGAMPTVSAGAPGGALPVASAASPPGQAPPLPCLYMRV